MSDVTVTVDEDRSSRRANGATMGRDHRERHIAEVVVRYGLSYLGGIVGAGHLMPAAQGVGRTRPR